MVSKPERIRDPVHDLIEFGTDEFEHNCWQIVRTAPFQRLRRIKQLGFSETVYPGATHSRLAHSLGVFHTARQLTSVVKANRGASFDSKAANAAVAAALVHDIGHGPFSHAFESALEEVGISGSHEEWTVRIILETDVRNALDKVAPNFADSVATIFKSESPADVYCSIVSSQFDADRLDYMRRDRLMTGTQQGGIDFRWLIANLQIGRVPVGQDDRFVREAETFVLGQKSVTAAEAYVLGLFQLYPTVYLHKTTRGAEKIFSALLRCVFTAVKDQNSAKTGLPAHHTIVRFILAPNDLYSYLALDDTAIVGSLPLLQTSSIPVIAKLATRLLERKFYKCVDITQMCAKSASEKFPGADMDTRRKRYEESRAAEAKIRELVGDRKLTSFTVEEPDILEDIATRNPYKKVLRDDGALNRIWVIGDDGHGYDLGELSPVVRGLVPFHAYRLYYGSDSGEKIIEDLLQEVLR